MVDVSIQPQQFLHTYLFLILFCFHELHSTNLQRQSEQGDESACVVVVIHITGGEGCQRLVVEAVRRCGSGFDDVAFVKFEFYFASYILLSACYECADSITQRSEPFSFVYIAQEYCT